MVEENENSRPAKANTPLFKPGATAVFRAGIILAGTIVFGAAFTDFEYYHSPYWTRVGLAPDQPVLFSHRHHAGDLRIDCRFCHTTVETSAFAGMPTTQICLGCHSQIFADTAMLQPVMRSAAAEQPLQWNRVTTLPDFVYFNHSIHVAKGVTCATCHGNIGDMALTAKAESLTMRWCLDCHRNPALQLQPRREAFTAGRPPGFVAADAVKLAPVDAIHAAHLTSCSTCHH